MSVLIVTWNSAAHLPPCLDALGDQTYREFEVIVVDNNSSDGCVIDVEDRYRSLDLRVERLNANQGFAEANNLAANIARGSWLALLNPDAFPEPEWLGELVSAAHRFPACFFASRQVRNDAPDILEGEGDLYHPSGLALRRNYGSPVRAAGFPQEVFSACAASALYPRQAFLDVGGFDSDFFLYHEDVDLGFRLRHHGLKCMLVRTAVVKHVGGASTRKDKVASAYYGHRNLVWTYVKNMPSPWVWIYLPLHLLFNLASLAYFGLTGTGRVIWRAKMDALRGLGVALKKRGGIQTRRQASSAEILRAMTHNPFLLLRGWWARLRVPAP